MEEGWLKFYRKFTKWEWYKTPGMYHLFSHLLFNANRQDKKWEGIILKRGQLATGRKQLSADTGISEQSVRTCLERLKSTNEITIKSTNKFSVITITKYEDYQINNNDINQLINQQSNQQLTSNQPATNHKQEYKNIRKEEKKEINNKENFKFQKNGKEKPDFQAIFRGEVKS